MIQCTLCKQEINNYNKRFNHLDIDKDNSVDICSECIDKFRKWQKNILSDLFPTKIAKKIK